MRIFTKFHDYYDGVGKITDRQDFIWERHTNEVPFDGGGFNFWEFIHDIFFAKSDLRGQTFVIIFCGKVFAGIKVEEITYWKHRYLDAPVFFYDPAEFKAFNDGLGKHGVARFGDEKSSPSGYLKNFSYADWLDFETRANRSDILSTHRRFSTPTMAINRGAHTVMVNPKLADYGFFKILDPYQTYQELDMFVNAHLHRPTRPMIPVSNTDMLAKKGFDKFSFRTPKTDKKR